MMTAFKKRTSGWSRRAEEERAEALKAKRMASLSFLEASNKAARGAMYAKIATEEAVEVNHIKKASGFADTAAECSKTASSAAVSCRSSGYDGEGANTLITHANDAEASAKKSADEAAKAVSRGKAKLLAEACEKADYVTKELENANFAAERAVAAKDSTEAAAKMGKVDAAIRFKNECEAHASTAADIAAKISAAAAAVEESEAQAGDEVAGLPTASVREAVAESLAATNLANQAVQAVREAIGLASGIAAQKELEAARLLASGRWCCINGKNPPGSTSSTELLLPPLPAAKYSKQTFRNQHNATPLCMQTMTATSRHLLQAEYSSPGLSPQISPRLPSMQTSPRKSEAPSPLNDSDVLNRLLGAESPWLGGGSSKLPPINGAPKASPKPKTKKTLGAMLKSNFEVLPFYMERKRFGRPEARLRI